MKISKLSMFALILAVTTGLFFSIGSLSEWKEVKTDLANSVQHIWEVVVESHWEWVASLLTDYSKVRVKLTSDVGNLLINGKTIDTNNSIVEGSASNVLGGRYNELRWSFSSSIIAWSWNKNFWNYSTIWWWTENVILNWWNANTVVWWEKNTITSSDYSTIVWWEWNSVISSTNAVVAWTNNRVNAWADNSVGLWSWSRVEWANSFLWSDGWVSRTLDASDVFAVLWENWMVVNTNSAHRLAQLTVWWSLVVWWNDAKNNEIVCEGWAWQWIMKLVDKNGSQKCLCSCNWQNWDSLMWDGQCKSICNYWYDVSLNSDDCWEELSVVVKDWKKQYEWTCKRWEVINGSYYMSKENVYWACQEIDGSVAICNYTLWCTWTVPNFAEPNNNITPDSEYPYEFSRNKWSICTYSCIDEYAWYNSNECRRICNTTNTSQWIWTCYFGNYNPHTTRWTNSYTYWCNYNDGFGMFEYKCRMSCPSWQIWAGESKKCQPKYLACWSNKYTCDMWSVSSKSSNEFQYTWRCVDADNNTIYSCSKDKEVRVREVYYNKSEWDSSTSIDFSITWAIETWFKVKLEGGSYTFTINAGSTRSESKEYASDTSWFEPYFLNGSKTLKIGMWDFVYELRIANGDIVLNYCTVGCKNAWSCRHGATSSNYSSSVVWDEAKFSWKCGGQSCSASCSIKNWNCTAVPTNWESCDANQAWCAPIKKVNVNLSDFYMTALWEVTMDSNWLRDHCVYNWWKLTCTDASNMWTWDGWKCGWDYTMDENSCSCNWWSACNTSTNPWSCEYWTRTLPSANYKNAYTYKCDSEDCPTTCPAWQVWLWQASWCVPKSSIVLCNDWEDNKDSCLLWSTLWNTWDEWSTHYWKCSRWDVTNTCSATPPAVTDCESTEITTWGITYVINSMSEGDTTVKWWDDVKYCTAKATCSNTNVTLSNINCVTPCPWGTWNTATCNWWWSATDLESATYNKSYSYNCLYSWATFKCNGTYGPKRNCNGGRYWNGNSCWTAPAMCDNDPYKCKWPWKLVSNSTWYVKNWNTETWTWKCYTWQVPQELCSKEVTTWDDNCPKTTTWGYEVPKLDDGVTTWVVKYTQADWKCTRDVKCRSGSLSFVGTQSCDAACNTSTNPWWCKSWVSWWAWGYDGVTLKKNYGYKCYWDTITWSCTSTCGWTENTLWKWETEKCVTISDWCENSTKFTCVNGTPYNFSTWSDGAWYYWDCKDWDGKWPKNPELCHKCNTNYERSWAVSKCVWKVLTCLTWTLPSSHVGDKWLSKYTFAWNELKWTYKSGAWLLWPCEYRCESWYTWANCTPEARVCSWEWWFYPWEHTVLWASSYTSNTIKYWTYVDSSNPWACEYTCEVWYSHNRERVFPLPQTVTWTCVLNSCKWTLPSYAVLNNPSATPSDTSTYYFYSTSSNGACAYSCDSSIWAVYTWGKCRIVDHYEWEFYDVTLGRQGNTYVWTTWSLINNWSNTFYGGCNADGHCKPSQVYWVIFEWGMDAGQDMISCSNDWWKHNNRDINVTWSVSKYNSSSYFSSSNSGDWGIWRVYFNYFEKNWIPILNSYPSWYVTYDRIWFAREDLNVIFANYSQQPTPTWETANQYPWEWKILQPRLIVVNHEVWTCSDSTRDGRRHAELIVWNNGGRTQVMAHSKPIYMSSCPATTMNWFSVPALNDWQTSNTLRYGSCTATFKCNDGTLTRTSYSCSSWGWCFLEWTHVLTEDWYKNIEDIEVGDMVLSYNPVTEQNEYNKVIKKFVHEDIDDELYELVINWRLLKTTKAHRFYVVKWERNDWYQCSIPYEWVAAGKLNVWNVLMMNDGTYVTIDSIEHYPYHWDLYNLWVENVNNYYVDEWYLVHNSTVRLAKQAIEIDQPKVQV